MKCIAVVGVGTIGAGWAAYFLARGLDVIATDPSPQAEGTLRRIIEAAKPALEQLGYDDPTKWGNLRFTPHLEEAVASAHFIQENGPEDEKAKIAIFAMIDGAADKEAIISSSSSGLAVSAIQRECRHPDRCVIGHPFNPPYLIPLVEVLGGEKTSEDAVVKAMAFYRHIGKRPMRVRREVPGYVANRLQNALFREAAHLVNENVATVEDVDVAIQYGPGLRWSLMGPFLTFALGGGEGGLRQYLTSFSDEIDTAWRELGAPVMSSSLAERLVRGSEDQIGSRKIADLVRQRDMHLTRLLRMLEDNAGG